MKRFGFSLAEILIVIFTLTIIAAVLFPLKIVDLNQAERIATWKTFYPELVYAFDIMRVKDNNLIQQYKSNCDLNPLIFYKKFSEYLSVNPSQNVDFSRYRHKFLNGKIIDTNSKYKSGNYIYLKNGMYIGFKDLKRNNCTSKNNEPLGLLFVDIDGKSRRNILGRDIFIVEMYADKIEPMGYQYSMQELKEDCSPVGSGLKCATYYLSGGAF